MTPQAAPNGDEPLDQLPVHSGNVPPEGQIRGMASPDDLEFTETEEEAE